MKKKNILKIILTLLIVSSMNVSNAFAMSNPYSQYTSWGDTNCTWYAWKMAKERAGVSLPGWGNAKTWYESAKKAGYSVGTTPRANSIAVWTNCDGYCGTYGHVGYVEGVSTDERDGTILYIKDSTKTGMSGCPDTNAASYKECIANSVDAEGDEACRNKAPKRTCPYILAGSGITGYIYLDNAPKNPKGGSGSSNSSNTSVPKEEKKSNNAFLKELKVSNVEIEFSKETYEYSFKVENEIETITIEATPEDEKASVQGTGEHSLEVGENEIKLIVKAEDDSKKEYTLKITRKEEIKLDIDKMIVGIAGDSTRKNNMPLFLGIGIGALLTIFVIILLIWKRKRKKIRLQKETNNDLKDKNISRVKKNDNKKEKDI